MSALRNGHAQIEALVRKLSGSPDESIESRVAAAAKMFLSDWAGYEFRAPISISKLTEGFLSRLNSDSWDEQDICFFFYFFSCVIRESSGSLREFSGTERIIINDWLTERFSALAGWRGFYWTCHDYVVTEIPVRVLEARVAAEFVRSEDVEGIRNLISNTTSGLVAQVDSLQKSLFEETGMLEDRIRGYKLELKSIASEYSFAKISNAFSILLQNKRINSRVVLSLVSILAIFALALPLFVIFGNVMSIKVGENFLASPDIARLTAFLVAEVLAIYYFRVALKSYLAAREQVTSLSLRLSLCQFIESYVDFSAGAPKGSERSMEMFERLIFSPLPTSDQALPSAFEGLDGVLGLLKDKK